MSKRTSFLHPALALLATTFVGIAVLIAPARAEEPSAADRLRAHSDEFREDVIEVTDGVHVAIGFGLANSILIEGDDGLIVVDVMESPLAARRVKEAFDQISTKPVKALVYTHNHYDHVNGGNVFAADGEPDVFAHGTTLGLVQARGELRGAIFARSIRQFGITLPDEARINAGIGKKLIIAPNPTAGFLPPTKTVPYRRLEVTVAGVEMHLIHAPGETDDQIIVWLPEKKTLLPGDNIYRAFPNLYAIRGTPYRDPRKWVSSLETMRSLKPEFLVPSHTRPIVGGEEIDATLATYRDGIQAVYDQTIAGMNAGLTPDELVERVRLPDELADHPYLQPFYGTVAWSVRAIYAGRLGWFDGNATNLFPLPPIARAEKFVRLAGGEDALLDKVRSAVDEGEYQWACEMVDHLIRVAPEHEEALRLKVRSLRALGEEQLSANARNYYLTSALEIERQLP